MHNDWFFEGAWDGPFDGPSFAEATTCTGTGARIHGDTVEFVSPTHHIRGLVTLKTSEHLFVANSIPFILAQAGDIPDINYLNYYKDLHFNIMNGFVQKPRPLVMRNGGRQPLFSSAASTAARSSSAAYLARSAARERA